MTENSRQLVREFLEAFSRGGRAEDMLVPDMAAWTVLGSVDRAMYVAAFDLFPRLFKDPVVLTIHSLTAEEDRVVAEFSSEGTLKNGDVYHNDYLFLFRVRGGKIAYVGEYFNPDIVREKIQPAMLAAMTEASTAKTERPS